MFYPVIAVWLFVTTLFASPFRRSSDDYNAIQNTLSNYGLATDSKDFAYYDHVFSPNVIANYGELGTFRNLSSLENFLHKYLAPVDTSHIISTIVIDVHKPTKGMYNAPRRTANSTSYYTTAQFGKKKYHGQVLYSYGVYKDLLELRPNGWRVYHRVVLSLGPSIGNASVYDG